jgi:hypothetical protein
LADNQVQTTQSVRDRSELVDKSYPNIRMKKHSKLSGVASSTITYKPVAGWIGQVSGRLEVAWVVVQVLRVFALRLNSA